MFAIQMASAQAWNRHGPKIQAGMNVWGKGGFGVKRIL